MTRTVEPLNNSEAQHNPATSTDLSFRDADPSEDDELARILYNAFLPIWNHNWFQCLTTPLASIPSTSASLTLAQARRLAFYRSWIAFVRTYNGDVVLAYTPTSSHPAPSSDSSPPALFTTSPSPIAAVTLLLPPHARPSWFEPLIAWRTGLLPSIFSFGFRGSWRILVTFEGNVHRMIAKGLSEMGIADGKEERLLFCQGCVRNPEWDGRASARRLFDWAIRRWWARQRERGEAPVPIWLDTTIGEGVRAYEEIGFRVLGECMVETGTDKVGIKLCSGAGEEKEEVWRIAKQWVMVRLPE